MSHNVKNSLEDFDPQARIYCRVIPWKDQFGFRKSHSTRDAIAALHVLYERNLEYNNKVYVCYSDYEKAFDRCRLDQTNDDIAKYRSRLERQEIDLERIQ